MKPAQWAAIREAFGHCCAYCRRPVEDPEMEHVVPVSKGGKTEAVNLVPSCKRCNLVKHNASVETAAKRIGFSAAEFRARHAAVVASL